ncbi:hypothetical protein D3C76_1335670 [compost metagenome]
MEPAQVVGQQSGQQARTVVPGVLLEVGVEAAHHRNPQAPRGAQGGETQRALGGDIEHIRFALAPATQQLVQTGLAPLQAGVPRQRPAADQHQFIVAPAAVVAGLARAHQLQPVPGAAQAVAETAEGVGHTVDFRQVGFADQRDVQGRYGHGASVDTGHVARVTAG